MSKYCESCGKELKKGAKFCPNCGSKVQIEKKSSKGSKTPPKSTSQPTQQPSPTPVTPEPVTPQPMQQSQPTQQYYQQLPPQPGAPPQQPQKSKTGLIIAIVATVAIVVVLLVVIFMFIGGGGIIGGGNESNFYGTWETSVGTEPYMFTYEMVFNNDKTLEYGLAGLTYEIGTWSVNNNKLDLKITMVGSDLSSQAYDYEFSNGGNTLTLKSGGVEVMTMTKK